MVQKNVDELLTNYPGLEKIMKLLYKRMSMNYYTIILVFILPL